MTPKQALTQARKRWGKHAAIECEPKGAFIGDDGLWHDGITRVCKHGQAGRCIFETRTHPGQKCPRDFYVISRAVCEYCENGTKYELGRVKYPVARYKVGNVLLSFFHISGTGATWTDAFAAADPKPKHAPLAPKPEPITAADYVDRLTTQLEN